MNGLIVHSDWGWRSDLGRYHPWWERPGFIRDEMPDRVTYIPDTVGGVNWYIGYDLGEARTLDGFAVFNTNLYSVGAVFLFIRASDDGTNFDDIAAFHITQESEEYGIVGTFAQQSRRYIELATSSTDANRQLEIGTFMVGRSHEFESIPSEPHGRGQEGQAKIETTVAAADTLVPGGEDRRSYQLRWELASATEADTWRTVYENADGSHHPIAYADHHEEALAKYGSHPDAVAYPCRAYSITRMRLAQLEDADHYGIAVNLRERR